MSNSLNRPKTGLKNGFKTASNGLKKAIFDQKRLKKTNV